MIIQMHYYIYLLSGDSEGHTQGHSYFKVLTLEKEVDFMAYIAVEHEYEIIFAQSKDTSMTLPDLKRSIIILHIQQN